MPICQILALQPDTTDKFIYRPLSPIFLAYASILSAASGLMAVGKLWQVTAFDLNTLATVLMFVQPLVLMLLFPLASTRSVHAAHHAAFYADGRLSPCLLVKDMMMLSLLVGGVTLGNLDLLEGKHSLALTCILVICVIVFVIPAGSFLIISSLNRSSLHGKCHRLLEEKKGRIISLADIVDLRCHFDRLQTAEGLTSFLGIVTSQVVIIFALFKLIIVKDVVASLCMVLALLINVVSIAFDCDWLYTQLDQVAKKAREDTYNNYSGMENTFQIGIFTTGRL